ncbi:hypothetical protein KEM48_005693 [Puccinia striiformis f. sp. tritici PST-130]|nr:hypothetical protein Pst134EB_018436 [Puccinia striiformis f. sp. tritici]KAI9615265.1 hypothetical protein KEM48_005693 [Puccinia striiformis f. sp. tritici PST-130]
MSDFISAAIDPALLSGHSVSTPTSEPSTSNPQASLAYPPVNLPPNSAAGSFSNNLTNNHGFNLASNTINPVSNTVILPNGSAVPIQGTPANTETPLSNAMSAKDQEIHQKDQELAQFLLKMEEYKPVIPDEVAAYYLQRVGFECTDIKVQRLLVLACQKFVSDIAQDAFSYARTRTGQAPGGRQGPLAPNSNSAGLASGAPNNPGTRKDRTRTVLTQEDLAQALAEYGINASRAPYYL